MSGLTELVISGPLLVAVLLALAAGAVSFASPCCLPLVPGYLAYLTGLAGTALADPAAVPDRRAVGADPGGGSGPGCGPVATRRAGRARLVVASVLFVAGFTSVFTAAIMVRWACRTCWRSTPRSCNAWVGW